MGDEMKKELIKDFIMEEKESLPRTLTPKDLVEILPFGRSMVYELLAQGEIPNRKVRGKIMINTNLFLIWLYSTDENIPEMSNENFLNL